MGIFLKNPQISYPINMSPKVDIKSFPTIPYMPIFDKILKIIHFIHSVHYRNITLASTSAKTQYIASPCFASLKTINKLFQAYVHSFYCKKLGGDITSIVLN